MMEGSVQNQDVPEGYKLTDAGIIPIDWNVKTIGDITTVIRGASPRPKGDKRFYGGTVPRLMVEDVTRDGKFVTPIVDSLTEAGAKLSRPCPAGTLTLVCSGTVGVPSILAVDACIHDGFLGLTKVSNTVSIDYLYQFFLTQKERFHNSATHGGVFTNLTTDGVKEFLVALPPTVKEQTAIANALSDVDALISELEKLIAKKQAIKTATMQQLLTGKKRLPEFAKNEDGTAKVYKKTELGEIPEDWQSLSLGSDAVLKARIGWQALTTKEYQTSGDFFLVTGTDFDAGLVKWERCFHVSEWRYKQDTNIQLKEGDVLVTKDGTIGKVGYVPKLTKPATLNSGVFVIRPKRESFEPRFLFYILTSRLFDDFITRITAGSTITHLYQKDFVNFEFFAPEKSEQIAIATILSDMDSDIQALEQRLSKTRQIKQGMMQELLTGKTRLVKPESK
ncbi:restriction endonuclease subunit S [Vibrio parahaemolyticus]|uniref:restriction endonuclease subunit S n=1 Tax=Vibrio parahaemolyticus TaxID=670 RepID=UPI000F511E25|nr:restriction endonuclease subunit S [Vibrio parahaemolyticus]RPB42757.1 restriction endonuclease subunit S [Vibrio parahaemolyticus]